jgi:hypothetical protein
LAGLGIQMMGPLRTEYLINGKYGMGTSNAFAILVSITIPMVFRVLSTFTCGQIFHRLNFIAIKLISEDDASIIKDALLKLLDTMEELTINSSYSNGNKIDLYVSAFNFDASYAYLYSKNVQLGTIDAFTTSILTSTNTLACNKIRTYLQAIKRASTLISNSEINRIVYFEKQRSLVNSL